MLELPESEFDGFDLWPEPPRVALDERDVSTTIALGAGERYRYFLDAVRQSGWVWELEDAMSLVTWQDEHCREYVLVWPHPRFAELYAEHEAPGSRPVEYELGAWLETVETYYSFVVVFPVSLFDAGPTLATPDLAAQLRR